MDRRTLLAGMAALIPATVGAQATPDAQSGTAYDVLTRYLETIIRDGDLEAIPDFFDAEAMSLDDVYWQHAQMQSTARNIGDDFTLEIRVIFGDNINAMSFVHYGPPDRFRRALFTVIEVGNGKIVGYRWSQDAI